MELQKCIDNRRTIRDFSQSPVPFGIVRTALENGLKAPTYDHLRQWDFILVKDQNIRIELTQTEEMLEEVSEELLKSFEGHDPLAVKMYVDAIPKQKRMILSAPELLVVAYKTKTIVAQSKRIYDLNCLASAWCCIENILLSLAGNDIFGVTFIPKNTYAVKEVLKVPQNMEIAAIIPFGYKASDAKILRQKEITLDSRLHINKW